MTVTYDFNCRIVFANDKVISTYLRSVVDYNNGRQGEDDFKTINYNSKSGDIVNFNTLILKDKIPEMDTLIIHRMIEIMNDYEVDYVDNKKYWKEQLNNLNYILSRNGINIIMTNQRGGYNSNSWKQEIFLTLDEIKDFICDKELFK